MDDLKGVLSIPVIFSSMVTVPTLGFCTSHVPVIKTKKYFGYVTKICSDSFWPKIEIEMKRKMSRNISKCPVKFYGCERVEKDDGSDEKT